MRCNTDSAQLVMSGGGAQSAPGSKPIRRCRRRRRHCRRRQRGAARAQAWRRSPTDRTQKPRRRRVPPVQSTKLRVLVGATETPRRHQTTAFPMVIFPRFFLATKSLTLSLNASHHSSSPSTENVSSIGMILLAYLNASFFSNIHSNGEEVTSFSCKTSRTITPLCAVTADFASSKCRGRATKTPLSSPFFFSSECKQSSNRLSSAFCTSACAPLGLFVIIMSLISSFLSALRKSDGKDFIFLVLLFFLVMSDV